MINRVAASQDYGRCAHVEYGSTGEDQLGPPRKECFHSFGDLEETASRYLDELNVKRLSWVHNFKARSADCEVLISAVSDPDSAAI